MIKFCLLCSFVLTAIVLQAGGDKRVPRASNGVTGVADLSAGSILGKISAGSSAILQGTVFGKAKKKEAAPDPGSYVPPSIFGEEGDDGAGLLQHDSTASEAADYDPPVARRPSPEVSSLSLCNFKWQR